ncbi:hypothetical protein N3K66_009098 [Trichothecium roseum]|uniref:Uncharacterized protein n=1 Tax=Trichothecium roseum TaxID=47278 RepID=A0ACC0UPJ1_9HYPO|nr:hypothetical protein N3K66_009098 [Trichothecium roseum]
MMSARKSPYIQRVAIVGAAGQIGLHITGYLLKTGKHTVTALTRANSSNTLPENVNSFIIDYDEEETIVDALRDQQFLIVTLTNRAVHDAQPKLINAAAKAGVSYVMPNWYGPDLDDKEFAADLMVAAPAQAAIKQIQ